MVAIIGLSMGVDFTKELDRIKGLDLAVFLTDSFVGRAISINLEKQENEISLDKL